MNSGIYTIRNLINNKVYVGSAVNFSKREANHFSDLRRNRHINPKLQHAWNKYTEVNFAFEIIEVCKEELLLQLEDFYIALYDAVRDGYNICFKAGSQLGRRWKNGPPSEETRAKIGAANKGKRRTEAQRIIISEATKKAMNNIEVINKLKESLIGKQLSEDHKRNIGKSLKGREIPQEHREKISNTLKGHEVTEATREKLRAKAIEQWDSQTAREAQSNLKKEQYKLKKEEKEKEQVNNE